MKMKEWYNNNNINELTTDINITSCPKKKKKCYWQVFIKNMIYRKGTSIEKKLN